MRRRADRSLDIAPATVLDYRELARRRLPRQLCRLLVKGVLNPADARRAADVGVDGIVVSNHGGRQLDSVPSTARALPEIVDAVGGRVEVLADGGVRSGLDVFKLIALGASAVLIGRGWAWAVAARGEAGVRHVLDILKADLDVALALTGNTSFAEVDRSALHSPAQVHSAPGSAIADDCRS